MSIISALSANAEQYFEQEYSRDDYYSQNHKSVGQWMGKGAQALGLSGEVKREDFAALLRGHHPATGETLVTAATHNGKRRPGWDIGLGVPKSLSVQALTDPRIRPAIDRAVETTFEQIEQYALARKGGDVTETANLVIARFRHDAARPTGKNAPPDPHQHDHLVMLNITQKPDGEWRALDTREIFKAQRWVIALFRAELAKNVQQLGYQIHLTPHEESPFELAGWTREQVLAFSKRHQEIAKKAQELHANGAAAHHDIALFTRQPKQPYDPAEARAAWLEAAAALGIDLDAPMVQALRNGNLWNGQSATALASLDYATKHLSEHHAVLDRRNLEEAALAHGCGLVDLAALRSAIDFQQQQGKLISTGANARHAGGAFVTPEMLQLERENIAFVQDGKNQARAISGSFWLRAWTSGKTLSDEQHHAVDVTLTSRDRVTAIEGFAGTAKTTTVGAIRDLAHPKGYMVRCFGISTGSVRALEEAGLAARTVASLIYHPAATLDEYKQQGFALHVRTRRHDFWKKPDTPPPELWIIDESSLVSSFDMNRILRAAREQSPARIVFVGDQNQHQAVGAGNPMRQFLDNGLTVAHLKTIYRQKEAGLRTAVELSKDAPAQSVDLLDSQHRVQEIADARARYKKMAADYVKSIEAGKTTLIVSPANDERKALNAEVRNAMIASGRVAKDGLNHTILARRDLTQEQLKQASSFEPGNVLRFNEGSWRIPKGSELTVEAVDAARNSIALRATFGRIEINPASWQGLQAYKPELRTMAKGERIQFRAPHQDKEHKIANGQFATIASLTASQWVQLGFDNERTWWGGQRKRWFKLDDLKHIDYGYCSTSHSAQGATVDNVLINEDSKRGAGLVNHRQHYVALSRAREDAQIYTDNIAALKAAVSRDELRECALDAITPRRSVRYDTKPSPPLPDAPARQQQQQQTQRRGFGFRLSLGS